MRVGPPPGAAFGLPLATPPLSALPLGAPLGALSPPLASAADLSAFAALGALGAFSSFADFSALGFFSSAIDLGSRTLGDPDLLAVRLDLEADAGRLAI